MVRKGYKSELETKKSLEKEYGENQVIKVAIGQMGADFLCVNEGYIVKLVEVKERHTKYKQIAVREAEQLKRIINWSIKNKCRFEIWWYHILKRRTYKEIEVVYSI